MCSETQYKLLNYTDLFEYFQIAQEPIDQLNILDTVKFNMNPIVQSLF